MICFDISKAMKVVYLEKIVECNAKIQSDLNSVNLLIVRASEKIIYRKFLVVPRSSTGVLV